MDLDVKIKAVMLGAVFLIVSLAIDEPVYYSFVIYSSDILHFKSDKSLAELLCAGLHVL